MVSVFTPLTRSRTPPSEDDDDFTFPRVSILQHIQPRRILQRPCDFKKAGLPKPLIIKAGTERHIHIQRCGQMATIYNVRYT